MSEGLQRGVVVQLGAATLSFLCLILACVIYGNWWPMMTLIPYGLLPIPCMFCPLLIGDAALGDKASLWVSFGYMLAGFFVVSAFGTRFTVGLNL